MKPLLFLCLCFLFSNLLSQPLTPGQEAAIGKAFLADIPAGGPGGAIGIVRNGEVIYTGYAGLADLETGRPIDAQTRFNIASNAKQFTAIAALKLSHAGKISLADDIRKYLPGLYPEVTEPITLAHLINHTSGIRDVYNLWGFQGITWWKESLSNDDALQLVGQQRELNFRPGSQYLYSNTNYLLLAQIIAGVSGMSFRAYTDELFTELGMTRTNFVDDHGKMGPDVGRPYFNFDTWTTYEWLTDLHGDGSLFSSLKDQLTWEAALQQGAAVGLDAVVLARSQQPVNDDAAYGFGVERGEYRGVPIRWHDGSTGAWDASFIRFPEQNLTIVASDNSGKFGTNLLVRTVADIILEDVFTEEAFPTEPEVVGAAIPVEKLVGTYLTDNGYSFVFKMVDGKLFLERTGRNDNELVLEAGNIYHQKFDPDFKQEFTRDEEGRMRVTAYYWAHAPYSLTRADVDWKDYDFAAPEGSFYNDELDVTLRVSYSGERRYEIDSGQDEMNGTLYQRDRMLAGNGNNVEFVRDAAGSVTELLISDDRTRKLRFVRQ